jgi:hypothetical protein
LKAIGQADALGHSINACPNIRNAASTDQPNSGKVLHDLNAIARLRSRQRRWYGAWTVLWSSSQEADVGVILSELATPSGWNASGGQGFACVQGTPMREDLIRNAPRHHRNRDDGRRVWLAATPQASWVPCLSAVRLNYVALRHGSGSIYAALASRSQGMEGTGCSVQRDSNGDDSHDRRLYLDCHDFRFGAF